MTPPASGWPLRRWFVADANRSSRQVGFPGSPTDECVIRAAVTERQLLAAKRISGIALQHVRKPALCFRPHHIAELGQRPVGVWTAKESLHTHRLAPGRSWCVTCPA